MIKKMIVVINLSISLFSLYTFLYFKFSAKSDVTFPLYFLRERERLILLGFDAYRIVTKSLCCIPCSYMILAPAAMAAQKDPKVAAAKCFEECALDPDSYRIGHTKAS